VPNRAAPAQTPIDAVVTGAAASEDAQLAGLQKSSALKAARPLRPAEPEGAAAAQAATASIRTRVQRGTVPIDTVEEQRLIGTGRIERLVSQGAIA
jgi:hypothetical protein